MRKIRTMLENPKIEGNIGTILRNIYCFDAGLLLLPSSIKEKIRINKITGASGTSSKVAYEYFGNVEGYLRNYAYRKIGFVCQQDASNATPITEFDFKDNDLLIFGNEANGLTTKCISHCDELITIPILKPESCLNVGIAHGIGLYEVFRQKLERGERQLPEFKDDTSAERLKLFMSRVEDKKES